VNVTCRRNSGKPLTGTDRRAFRPSWRAGPDDVTTSMDPVICSAKGCRETAGYALVWNNPRLHAADREKVWAACEQHRESLSQHLALRSFLRRVDPLP
jgi:hypothetical protein